MNPLELVAKTLHSFSEKELTYQLLDAFGNRAQNLQQFDDVAKIFFEVKNFPKAIEYGIKALEKAKTKQEQYIISKNLINAYNQSNYPEKALAQIEFCKTLNPQDVELLLEETFAYSALGQKDKSDELLFELIKRKLPEEIERKAYHNLSGYYFRNDDLNTALKHFLRAGEIEAYKNQKTPDYEKWDGTITPGRTIIIDNQCGAGDEVIHVRFMKTLKDLGMNPIWSSTRRELVELFNYNGFDSVCCFDNPEFPKDSCWVYGLALPYYLNLKIEDLGKEPYLKTIPSIDKKWEWIKEDGKTKIGLFWASSSGYEQNQFRSVDIEGYMNILKDKDVSLYSLQTYNDNNDADKYPQIKKSTSIKDREYYDTFSIINNLDFVITSCSFTAHVAASLGKEVCVFVPIMEYYVWTHDSGKSQWYGDNVHLFKQEKPRDWEKPLKELEIFLNDRGI
jgi:tetratricopeptide (TPR) repeat protein